MGGPHAIVLLDFCTQTPSTMENVILTQLSIEDLRTLFRDEFDAFLRKQTKDESDRWLDLDTLCEYLPNKPAKATVYGWVNKELIPFQKNGKRLNFLKSEIDAWLLNGRRSSIVEPLHPLQKKSPSKG